MFEKYSKSNLDKALSLKSSKSSRMCAKKKKKKNFKEDSILEDEIIFIF